jgi:hypothetical protein
VLDDFSPPDGYVTEDRAEDLFAAGAQAMREMLAQFVEQGGNLVLAESIRANWHPGWGKDPGRPDSVAPSCWES